MRRLLLVSLGISCARWVLKLLDWLRGVFLSRLFQPIVDCEVVQLGEVFMDTQDLLVLNRLLHLRLCCIALLLLLNEFLNFRGV